MARRPSSRGPIDTYLDLLGLYRLKVPPQEQLFRIVAEQLCFTQTEYPKFKKMACERLLLTPEKYSQHTAEPMEEHVLKLQEGRTVAGIAEMLALADITRHDFWLYREVDRPPTDITCRGFSRRVVVAGGNSSHYDLVISKQEATDRALAQSLVYHALYAGVYHLRSVHRAVDKMLYDKEYARTRKESLCSQDGALAALVGSVTEPVEPEPANGSAVLYAVCDDEPCDVMDILDSNMVPFPYKTAKALDSSHYRNLPQDVWAELVKERRREQQRPDCNGFLAGIKCLVALEGVLPADELARLESEARPECRHMAETGDTLYVAHIQEMAPNQGPVCCYVEPLGRKLTVPYECLRPLCSTPVPCPLSPSLSGARPRTPGRRRSRHSTSERSSCSERHLSLTDSSCSTPQELGFSAPSYLLAEPPVGLVSPVALAAAPYDPAGLLQPPSAAPAGPPQPFGVHLIGSPVLPPQLLPPTAGAGLEPRLRALALATEPPPVAPGFLSPPVAPGPEGPAWQLVAGPAGGPMLAPPPPAAGSPQSPFAPPPYQVPPQQLPAFYGYAAPGTYEQQQQRADGGGGGGLFPLEVLPPLGVTEPADFYSPGSAGESGYRSRNASHSSTNSVDGSMGDLSSPHNRIGGMRHGRPAKVAQPGRNLPPRLSKYAGPPPPPPPPPLPPPPPPVAPGGPLLYTVAPPLFYPAGPPEGGAERLLLSDGSTAGYYLAAAPGTAGYLYMPPQQHPYPGQGQ